MYFALIRVSKASIFFACCSFCLRRFVIRSSWSPLALERSVVCDWRVLTLEVRLSRMWASWYARAMAAVESGGVKEGRW